MVRKLVIAVAAASALMSTGMVQALGVGDINLRSSLNQPLDAEIDLLQVRDLTSEEIRSMLASPDDFGRAGIERTFFLTDLKFTPVVKPNGKSVIRVTSSRPVNEPYLNFLMEVRWPSGKVLREFTVLLDPPLYQPASITSSAPVTAPTSSSAQISPPRPTIAPAQPRGSSPYATAPAATTQPSSTEWRTNPSDTLWEVALKSRPSGANVHQTMLAIQDLNPGAFINGNINQLKSGQTLKLPTSEQVAKRTGSEAVAEVAAQNRAWQDGRSAPAPTAADSAPSAPQLDARQRESAGAAPEQVDAEDSLRLVSGADEQVSDGAGDGAANANNASQLRDSLDRTKEQLDAAEREKAEMGERLDDVQGQLETLQRLLELKDAQLAALQQEISSSGENSELTTEPQADLEEIAALEQQQAEAEAGAVEGAQVDAEAVEVEPSADETAEVTPETELTDAEVAEAAVSQPEGEEAEASTEQPAAVEPQAPEVTEPAADVAPEVDEPAVAAPEPQASTTAESLLQRMMQNQMLLIGGGVIAILLLLMVLMAVSRRNARREADMADNFIANAADGHDADPTAGDSDDFNVALAAELDDDAGIAVDPLTEADGLLAYGKPQEAQAVLLAAVENEPERTDLRLKLLEVEGLLENAEGYRAQHEALRAAGTVDAQVDAMDARFPLMAAAVAGAAAGLAYDSTDEDEISFEMPADDAPAAVVEEEDMDFDFSEFEMGDSPAPAAAPEVVAEPATSSDEDIDFDLDFDLDDTVAPQDLQGATEPDATAADAAVELDESLDFTEFESLEETPVAESEPSALDDDFDLSLTDELQTDSLSADFDAIEEPVADKPVAEESFNLSEDDLAGFEVELDEAAGEAEQADVSLPLDTLELEEDEALSVEDDDLMPLENMTEEPVAGDLDEDDEFDFLSGTDESATKLDLARAYIDMGDSEGARDILNEVIDEGNEQQQQEAREMMERLTD